MLYQSSHYIPACVVWSYICDAFKCAHDHITNPQLYTQPLTVVSNLMSLVYYHCWLLTIRQLF